MARKPLEGIECYTDRIESPKRLLGASRDKENKFFDVSLEKKLSNQKNLKEVAWTTQVL